MPANKTHFCDAASSVCFFLAATPRNYTNQKQWCADNLSGTLVSYSSREKQMLVRGQGLMPLHSLALRSCRKMVSTRDCLTTTPSCELPRRRWSATSSSMPCCRV